jgi:hypothetical protein
MPVAQTAVWAWPARWLGWLLGLLVASGCGIFWANPAPTPVAEGRYYSSGDPEFDEFFLALHRVQVELESAPDRERKAVHALAQALELAEQELATLEKKLHARMDELHEQGTQTSLVRQRQDDPEQVSLTVQVQGRVPEDEERALLATIETSGTTLLELTAQTARIKDRLESLSLAAIRLEPNIGDHFRKQGPAKTDEVSKNLRDARKAIASMTATLDGVSDRSAKLLTELEKAVGVSAARPPPSTTPVAAEEAPPPTPTSAPAKRPTSVKKAPPRKRAAPPPPAAKPSKPASSPASDFEP